MKLLFSEAPPDYKHYIFPYAVWAFPEAGESPGDFFSLGFLPSSKNLDRFYLCRSVRIALSRFSPSSENRRIVRKCEGITHEMVPRPDFQLSTARRDFCLNYADIKFGVEVMTPARLENLFNSAITTHLLIFRDDSTGAEVGLVTLFLEPPRVAQYYYAFYDLNYFRRSLGMYMMTSAVIHFAESNMTHLYLGSCYSSNALYKTQFSGAEFFNGAYWSGDLEELKYLIARGSQPQSHHLFESEDYVHRFHEGDLGRAVERALFRQGELA